MIKIQIKFTRPDAFLVVTQLYYRHIQKKYDNKIFGKNISRFFWKTEGSVVVHFIRKSLPNIQKEVFIE